MTARNRWRVFLITLVIACALVLYALGVQLA